MLGRSPSDNDFSEENYSEDRIRIHFYKLQQLNKNVNKMRNLNLNVNHTLYSYYCEYATTPFVFLSLLTFFLPSVVSMMKFQYVGFFQTLISLIIKDGMVLFFIAKRDTPNLSLVGYLAGALFFITIIYNLLVVFLNYIIFVVDNILLSLSKVTSYKSKRSNKIKPANSSQDVEANNSDTQNAPPFDDFNHWIEEDNLYNIGSRIRRSSKYLDFLFLDIIMTLKLFPFNAEYGIMNTLIFLDKAQPWEYQLENKERPLTIITAGDPIVVVQDFTCMNGEESKQFEFTKIFSTFFNPCRNFVRVYCWKTDKMYEFQVTQRSIILGEYTGTNYVDRVFLFQNNKDFNGTQVKLVYSTLKLNEQCLFCEDNQRHSFLVALLSACKKEGYEGTNYIFKRLMKAMDSRKWVNIYKGTVPAKLICELFPIPCIILRPDISYIVNREYLFKCEKAIAIKEETSKCTSVEISPRKSELEKLQEVINPQLDFLVS